jgi:hypothetical protein
LFAREHSARRRAAQCRAATNALLRALDRIDPLRALPGLDLALGSHAAIQRGATDLLLLRPDAIATADGPMTILELNAGCSVGGLLEVERCAEVLRAFYDDALGADAARLRWPRPFGQLARALLGAYGASARFVWLAFGETLSDESERRFAEAECEALRAHGVSIEPASADELRYDDGKVFAGGRPVDVLFRVTQSRVFLERPELAAVREAVARGQVALYSSPWDLVVTNKGLLAHATTEPIDVEGVALAWTRLARPAIEDGVDLLPMVHARPEDFVVKPAGESQGAGVRIGRENPRAFRQALLEGVLADHAVVQRYCRPPRATLPYADDAGHIETLEGSVVLSPVVTEDEGSLCARFGVSSTEVLTHPYMATTALVAVVEVSAR